MNIHPCRSSKPSLRRWRQSWTKPGASATGSVTASRLFFVVCTVGAPIVAPLLRRSPGAGTFVAGSPPKHAGVVPPPAGQRSNPHFPPLTCRLYTSTKLRCMWVMDQYKYNALTYWIVLGPPGKKAIAPSQISNNRGLSILCCTPSQKIYVINCVEWFEHSPPPPLRC
jgi:hypothetical protein